LIEQKGYTVCDDLVHGFGGGYFQPIIGTKSRMAGRALPQMTLEENMTVVVQPNPVTTEADESKRSGVQVGELMRITRDGCEPLHSAPRGLFHAGDKI
jgi:Xaa-Pro aminopeptidase